MGSVLVYRNDNCGAGFRHVGRLGEELGVRWVGSYGDGI